MKIHNHFTVRAARKGNPSLELIGEYDGSCATSRANAIAAIESSFAGADGESPTLAEINVTLRQTGDFLDAYDGTAMVGGEEFEVFAS